MSLATPMLEIDGLSKRYGDLVALDRLTLSVGAGELFGFVGPNGAGKTTTMRVVLGVVVPDFGEVRFRGRQITFADRRRIGYMPEERGLYPTMGVIDQLVYLAELHGMDRRHARQDAEGWLERLGLKDRGKDQLQRLSHGNQQRVELAAALIHRPSALILDEPFAGLDPVAVDVMSGVLIEQAERGLPVIFSSHQLELVEQLCQRVGIIKSGRLIACGTVDELRASVSDRFWVDVPAAPPGWSPAVPGATLVRVAGSRRLVRLERPHEDQPLLRAALETGPVREFSRDLPKLSELFRHVMSEEASDVGVG